jgi:hypothetical protein
VTVEPVRVKRARRSALDGDRAMGCAPVARRSSVMSSSARAIHSRDPAALGHRRCDRLPVAQTQGSYGDAGLNR